MTMTRDPDSVELEEDVSTDEDLSHGSKKELGAAHKKSPGGMRRVDSLELHRLRLPEIVRKTKRPGPSSLGKRKATAQRSNTMTASLLSFMGLGGGTNAVVKA
mmetsp:Transcript_6489/g.28553  ORF Transcript_6489/g.28553 Transcript_6489/m.28553 type:complete len:103 (+) Transcript_6489:214-522(+)